MQTITRIKIIKSAQRNLQNEKLQSRSVANAEEQRKVAPHNVASQAVTEWIGEHRMRKEQENAASRAFLAAMKKVA